MLSTFGRYKRTGTKRHPVLSVLSDIKVKEFNKKCFAKVDSTEKSYTRVTLNKVKEKKLDAV